MKKWRSSNKDMNSKVEAGGSYGVYADTVPCSLTTASLISRKRLRTLGKVAQQCDAIDPPVPRRLRSAINKRVRHVKKRRHLSAISAQIGCADHRTRLDTSLLTEEEEVADALLSLSQVPSTCEFTADKVIIADSTNINVSSTPYSEGGTKEGDKITILPNAADKLSNQAACIVRQTESVPHVNPVLGDTNQPNNRNLPLLQNAQIKDLSLGFVADLPSPFKDSSNNSARKQLKAQLDDSKNCPAQKPEAWLVDSNKSDNLMHEDGKAKNDSALEIIHRVQTRLPCTPDGYLIKPLSSTLAVGASSVSEFSKVTSSGNLDKVPLVNTGVPTTKTWKRSITHVYVSHLIQTHLDKEKASHCQVKPEERSHIHASSSRSSPNGRSTFKHHESNAQDETRYAVRLDVRLPVQPPSSTGICSMSAGPQKMVSGSSLNLPASTALPAAGARHVQYQLHPPQIAPRSSSTPYPFPHLPQSRPSLARAAATLHQQMLQQQQQYMCPQQGGYSSAMMKLQQLVPPTQQQQQMWQFHMAHQQYQNAAPPGAGAGAGAGWHNVLPSLRPMSVLPSPAMMLPPQMELLCAPYHQGGSRQPQQLRLM